MDPSAEDFFALDSEGRRIVHLELCRHALEIWEGYARAQSPITYQDSVVGITHTLDQRLPRDAFESSRAGRALSGIAARYNEPIVAMQDDDLELPENIEYAYYAIHNLFRKYVQGDAAIDDWLIVNQALSAESGLERWKELLSEAVAKARRIEQPRQPDAR